MRALMIATALTLASSPAAIAQQLKELDKPASELKQVLAHPVQLPAGNQEVRVVRATIDPKTAAGWHTHPTPVYVYVVEGELTMEVEGKDKKKYRAGEATAEPLNARMRVLNEGDTPAELVVFQISPSDKKFLETKNRK